MRIDRCLFHPPPLVLGISIGVERMCNSRPQWYIFRCCVVLLFGLSIILPVLLQPTCHEGGKPLMDLCVEKVAPLYGAEIYEWGEGREAEDT